MQTIQDFNVLPDLLTKWFREEYRHSWDVKVMSQFVIQTLLNKQAKETLFTLLCNRWRFRLLPTMEDLHQLFGLFQKDALETASLENLDKLYQTFALFLYYDKIPTTQVYSGLVSTGLYNSSEEGVKRSEMTWKEMENLGLEPTREAYAAWTWFYLQKEKYQEAHLYTKKLSSDKEVSVGMFSLGMEAALKSDHLRDAVVSLERLVALESDGQLKKDCVGSEKWTSPIQVILDVFLGNR